MKALTAFSALLERSADLVVIDGVTDAVGIDGGSVLDNDEVAAWMRRVPRTIARRTGTAVACIDHVVKSANGGRFAIGAQAKMAGVDGAVYLVEPKKPLGCGMCGELTEFGERKLRRASTRRHPLEQAVRVVESFRRQTL